MCGNHKRLFFFFFFFFFFFSMLVFPAVFSPSLTLLQGLALTTNWFSSQFNCTATTHACGIKHLRLSLLRCPASFPRVQIAFIDVFAPCIVATRVESLPLPQSPFVSSSRDPAASAGCSCTPPSLHPAGLALPPRSRSMSKSASMWMWM